MIAGGKGTKVYLAGIPGGTPATVSKIVELLKRSRRLHSYFYKDGTVQRWYDVDVKNGVDLFLDSGGFSAFTQGVKIDIQEYIKFIKEHEHVFTVYANLDVITAEGSSRPDRRSAELSLENQKIMEAAGLKPIPVFHIGEPFEFLEYYVKNYDYIGLGFAKHSGRIPFLDLCFGKYICGPDGIPKVKVHGFAATSLQILFRYPWYSVDSTSWVVLGRMGGIYVPRRRNGKWVYDDQSWQISVSTRSPDRKVPRQHIDTMPPKERAVILDYIHEKGYVLGKSRFVRVPQTHELAENERWADNKPKDPNADRLLEVIEEEGLSNRYQLRDEINIMYFLDLEKHLPQWPWPFKRDLRGTRLL